MKVYLDGDVANPEIQTTAAKNYNTSEIVLGTRSDGYAPFQGRLDEVAFFDTALTPAQIQAHFAAAKADDAGPRCDSQGQSAGLLAAGRDRRRTWLPASRRPTSGW